MSKSSPKVGLEMRLDDAAFRNFLENVKGSKLKSALRQGLRKTLMIIKKKAVSNLQAVSFKTGKLNVSRPVWFKKYYGGSKKIYNLPSFRTGVVVRVAKSGGVGNVSIYKKETCKDYNLLLPMIHNAKGDRSTKGKGSGTRAPHSTGKIGPHTFFGDAVQQTKQEVQDNLQKNLNDAIKRAQDKYNKG